MADLDFKISQNVILGSYTINRLPQNVDSFGSRFVVIMDAPLKDAGIQDKILQPLLERKIEYFVVDNTADGAGTKEIVTSQYLIYIIILTNILLYVKNSLYIFFCFVN